MIPELRKPPKNFHETVGKTSKAAYLLNPTKCPRCGSSDIGCPEGDFVTCGAKQALFPMSCPSCQLGWTDVYTLTDIAITEPKP